MSCGKSPDVATGRDKIFVGSLAALSGGDAELAKSVTRGMQLAMSEYNADRDSTFRAQLRQLDTKGTPEGAKQAADTLAATERVVGVVGPLSAAEASSAGQSLNAAHMTFLLPNVGSLAVPQPDWKTFRRMIANEAREGQLLGILAYRRTDGPIAIFSDGAEGVPTADSAKAALESKKRTVARFDAVGAKADLKALSASVVSAPPAGVIYSGAAKRGTDLIGALRKAGFKGPVFTSRQLKAGPPEKGLTDVFTEQPVADPTEGSMSDFAKLFEEGFGTAPTPFAVEAYEATLMLLEAVEESSTKAVDISDFLAKNRSFRGDSKSYEYSETGELPNAPFWTYEAQNENWKLVGRFVG